MADQTTGKKNKGTGNTLNRRSDQILVSSDFCHIHRAQVNAKKKKNIKKKKGKKLWFISSNPLTNIAVKAAENSS